MQFVDKVKKQLLVSSSEGLTLAQARCMLPRVSTPAAEDFQQVLRSDIDIDSTKEMRINAAGRMQEQVVLRLRT